MRPTDQLGIANLTVMKRKGPVDLCRSVCRHLLCALTLVFLPAVAADAQEPGVHTCNGEPHPPQAVIAALDEALAAVVDPNGPNAEKLGYAPGAELFVRTPDWTYQATIGVADIATATPIACGMPFQIGSNTKMMTGTVVMQLVEEGRISLDDPLKTYFPDFASGFPYGDSITIRQMATHTAGLFDYTDNAPNGAAGIMEGGLADPELLSRAFQPEELVRFAIENGEPSFAPGEEGQWAYSNTGFVLLGMIIEKITGQPLEDVFRQRIFAPLGMRDTFLWNGIPKPEFGLARGYYQPPFDIETTTWNMSQGWAAGAVISTAADMDIFIRALLGGELFNKPATLDQMLEMVPAGSTFRLYGIGIGEKLGGGFFGHGGQTLGFESAIGLFRDDSISMVLWTNSARDLAGIGWLLIGRALAQAGMLEGSR